MSYNNYIKKCKMYYILSFFSYNAELGQTVFKHLNKSASSNLLLFFFDYQCFCKKHW